MTTISTQTAATPEENKDRKPVLADRYKTSVCRNWEDTGKCPYDMKCMFAHGESELRTTEENIADGLTTEEAIKKKQRQDVAEKQQKELEERRAKQRERQQRKAAKAAAKKQQQQQQQLYQPPSYNQYSASQYSYGPYDAYGSYGSAYEPYDAYYDYDPYGYRHHYPYEHQDCTCPYCAPPEPVHVEEAPCMCSDCVGSAKHAHEVPSAEMVEAP